MYVQILDEAGRIVSRSANLGAEALPVHADRVADVLTGRSFYEIESIGGQNIRLYHRPILREGRIAGAVEVGASLRNLEDTLARLRTIFTLGILAALMVGAIGSYSLTRLGLRPLAGLAALAAHIGHDRDLAARLPLSGPLDEVGRLTVTFNEMLARLQAAFDAQRHFLAEASHELRTPLASLLGNADLLVRHAEDPQRRAAAFTSIRAEGQRLTRLLNDLLLSAQADAGWRLELRPLLLTEVLHNVVACSRLWANGVLLTLMEPPPVTVLGDADRLGQVFGNLVDNALRHTPAGGVVSVRSSVVTDRPSTSSRTDHYSPAADHWLRVVVSDTGEGIPPEALPHIFDRFYRASGRSRGYGLGLSIARWIVEQHGGRIEIESEIGKGSQFSVWLPVEKMSA